MGKKPLSKNTKEEETEKVVDLKKQPVTTFPTSCIPLAYAGWATGKQFLGPDTEDNPPIDPKGRLIN